MLLEINSFQGGIATNIDPNDLGKDFATVSQNFLMDQPGRLVKRPGRGSTVTINTLTFTDVKYWSPSNLKLNGQSPPSKWIGYDYLQSAKKLRFTDSNILGGVTPTDLGSAYSTNLPTDFDLQDHGTEFRMAPNNLEQAPKILQHISRNFFSGEYSVNEFVFQDALPSYPTVNEIVFISLLEKTSEAGYDMTNAEFNSYKLSAIYDGYQEMPLDESFKSITTSIERRANQIKLEIPATATGTAPNKTYSFNPRMTSIKIYRETAASGTLFHIGTIPINTKDTNTNKLDSTSTYKKGNEACYSDGFIGQQSVLEAGVFADFDTGIAESATIDVSVDWYVVKTSSGTNISTTQANGFVIWSANATGQDVIGPASDSTFSANLAKGIVLIENVLGGSAEFFDESCTIARITAKDDDNAGISFHDFTTQEIGVGGCGAKTIIFQDLALNERYSTGIYNGGILVHSSSHNIITGTLGKALKLAQDTTAYSSAVQVWKNYVETWDGTNNKVTYYFYDVGLTSGAPMPFVHDLKIQVHYKYSQMMGNRLFVGNVKLDPPEDDEDHPDWLIFSEAGMPDILPIVNYIQIKDQQGGEIIGLNKILNSLVVFMSRGTFRLDVGVTGSPADFILLESDKVAGCIAPKGILNIKDNLFFCAEDALYQISPDFRFNPITEPIKDVYQGTANKQLSRLFYDVKRNRMICKFGAGASTVYAYDLTSSSWSTLKFASDQSSFYSINDTLDVFGFHDVAISAEVGNLVIQEVHKTGSTESMDIVYRTGFNPVTKMDIRGIVRRVNLNYESAAALTCKVYTDGDYTTVLGTLTFPANNSSKDYLVSIRPAGIRAKTVALEISATTAAAVKINKVEIETDE